MALFSQSTVAKMRTVSVSLYQDWVAPRWQYDSKVKITGPPIVSEMVRLRKDKLNKKYNRCATTATKLSQSSKGMEVWLVTEKFDCILSGIKSGENLFSSLVTAVKNVDAHPHWLLLGAPVNGLKELYVEARVLLFERQLKAERREAWNNFDQIMQMQSWLNLDQLARVYRAGGELAFLEQNLSLAVSMLQQSLNEKDSAEVRKKLESIKSVTFSKKESVILKGTQNNQEVNATFLYGEAQGIVDRMQTALQSGDLISALEDGLKIIEKYSGSTAAKWATDRVLEIYLSLGAKTEGDFPVLRKRAVNIMVKADGVRLLRWEKNAFVKGYYQDVLTLGAAAIVKLVGQPEATKAISLVANAALYSGELSQAEKWFEVLVKEHFGSEESRQALFRLGLIRFRSGKWADSSAFFEKLLAVAPGSDWEYGALYWSWRCQQKLKSTQAAPLAEKLMLKYPLTYYGLRARAETNDGLLDLGSAGENASNLKLEMWLTEAQSQAWERFQILLKAGWFAEAQAELKILPEPQSPEERLIRSRMLVAAFDHFSAIKMLNQSLADKHELFNLNLAQYAFPREYENLVKEKSKVSGVDSALVWGLMRQESSFRAKVVSSSDAFGLMQLLTGTAQEVASSYKWKVPLKWPEDLYDPEINIKLGTTYLSRMVTAFNGHVPLALAAYNAGIGRVRRWLSYRPDLGDLVGKMSSEPEDEIWIEELPWEETSFYVKAVLRNLIFYRLIETQGKLKVKNPIWQ
ncbi:MAG: transglycosylase SLT domain-containing protein [Bdellovibrionales bacterium]|nr:transglycosylase SLT domain-containing protein [Bdellovibrionales bacterium]